MITANKSRPCGQTFHHLISLVQSFHLAKTSKCNRGWDREASKKGALEGTGASVTVQGLECGWSDLPDEVMKPARSEQ